jgi:hypothetical protein
MMDLLLEGMNEKDVINNIKSLLMQNNNNNNNVVLEDLPLFVIVLTHYGLFNNTASIPHHFLQLFDQYQISTINS